MMYMFFDHHDLILHYKLIKFLNALKRNVVKLIPVT